MKRAGQTAKRTEGSEEPAEASLYNSGELVSPAREEDTVKFTPKRVVYDAFQMTAARLQSHAEWPEWVHYQVRLVTGVAYVDVGWPRGLSLVRIHKDSWLLWNEESGALKVRTPSELADGYDAVEEA